MTKKLSLTVFSFVITLSVSALNSNQFMVDGIIYEKISGTDNVKVTYDPDKANHDQYGQPIGNTYSGIVTVPKTIAYNGITYSVTEVGDFAFAGGPGLTEVNLPETVTRIGIAGFYGNEGIKSITLPASVKTIDYHAFRNCYNLSSINFPEGLEVIGGDAFTHDRSLTELILPASLIEIDGYAFCACTGVKRVVLRDSDIPLIKGEYGGGQTIFDQMEVDYAYIGRTCYTDDINYLPIRIKTKELDFGDAVSSFSLSQFYPEFLEKLSIPPTCDRLNFSDFQNSTALKHIVIKDGETPIILQTYVKSTSTGNGTSYEYFPCLINCPLESAYVGRTFQQQYGQDGTQAFYNNKTLKNIVIGPLVKSLPAYGFQRCEKLEAVEFPESLESIGEACFADCHSLTSVKIPPLLTEIAPRVFDSCFELTNVDFNSNISSIGEMAFYYCGLTDVNIPSCVKTIGSNAFSGCRALTALILNSGLETIEQGAFSFCESITELTIPATVSTINNGAFNNLSSLKKLTFADSRKELICEYSLTYGNVIASPVFGNSMTDIEEIYMGRSFPNFHNSGNTTVTPSYAEFWGTAYSYDNSCSPVITFGTMIDYVNKGLFQRFPKITKVYCLGTDQIPSYGENAFYDASKVNVYVPQGHVSQYESHGWSGFASLQEDLKGAVPDVSAFAFDKTSETVFIGAENTLTLSVAPSDAPQEFTLRTLPVHGKTQGLLDYSIEGNVITLKGRVPGYLLVEAICTTNSSIKCSAEITICSVDISESHIVVGKNTSYTLTPVFNPEIDEIPVLHWSSSNPAIAAADSDGVITGRTSGVADITMSLADFPSVFASCEAEVGTLYNRNIIVESLVSTSEIYSVRGYAGLDMYKSLSDEYGKVIPIAVHVDFGQSDPMSHIVGDYSEILYGFMPGIPEFLLNRESVAPIPTAGDPKLFYPGQAQLLLEQKSIYGLEIINTVCPDNVQNKTPLSASIGIYPGRDVSEKLTITAVIVENNVSNVSPQNNAVYYNQTSANISDFDWQWMSPYCAGGKWGQHTIPASSMIYDYVARCIYPSFNGKEAGDSWKEGCCYNTDISFELPPNITKLENCELIVMLFDSKGRFVNATSMPSSQFQVSQSIVTDLSLNKSSLDLRQGSSETLTVSVSPSYINNAVISWTSSNEDVAVVSDGVITAVGPGSATITATTTDGSNLSASCLVSVKALVSEITIDRTSLELEVGEFAYLTATLLPDTGTDTDVEWTSSDDSIASVQNGLVLAHAEGEAIITVAATDDSGVLAECKVTVFKRTGLESVPYDDVKVYASDATINIENLPAGTSVRIIQYNGSDIFRTESAGARITFRPSAKGVYIIVLDNHSHKAVVL